MPNFSALMLTIMLLLQGVMAADCQSPEYNFLEQNATYSETADNRYILHAGGTTPDGKIGSNSLEALNYSYQCGYRTIEIDFCWTEDDHLVCVHDWDAYYAKRLGKQSVTLSEFEAMRYSTYGFTSMTLDSIADWLHEHDGAVIVTDIKERCVEGAALIAEKYPSLRDRFWIQIYDTKEYDAVSQLGFSNIVLTVYQMDWQSKTDTTMLTEFADTHHLAGLTFPMELIEIVPGYLDAMVKVDVPVYVHTINDVETQQMLFEAGVTGVYTDTPI